MNHEANTTTPSPEADPAGRRDEETRSLLSRRAAATDGDTRKALLDQAIELNLGIAYGIAGRFRGRGVESDDLDQVASLGLIKAAHSYDPGTDTPFLAYAVPTIRGEVKRYFRDSSWTVRIPRRLQELQGSIAAARPGLAQNLQREPTVSELADTIGADSEDVSAAMAADGCFAALSLDRPLDRDGADPMAEVLASEDASFERFETIAFLRSELNSLSPRERRILALRFVEEQTQADIGAEIGVSQMQVSRLLRGILGRLRKRIDSPAAAAA